MCNLKMMMNLFSMLSCHHVWIFYHICLDVFSHSLLILHVLDIFIIIADIYQDSKLELELFKFCLNVRRLSTINAVLQRGPQVR